MQSTGTGIDRIKMILEFEAPQHSCVEPKRRFSAGVSFLVQFGLTGPLSTKVHVPFFLTCCVTTFDVLLNFHCPSVVFEFESPMHRLICISAASSFYRLKPPCGDRSDNARNTRTSSNHGSSATREIRRFAGACCAGRRLRTATSLNQPSTRNV